MKVIICGSSHWTYNLAVEDEIIRLKRQTRESGTKLLIIHGGEPGPETIADKICKKLGIDRIIHPVVGVLGDSSYARRNSLMLLYHRPDLVVGFAHSLDESTVVRDMIQRADKMGYKSKVIDYKSLSR